MNNIYASTKILIKTGSADSKQTIVNYLKPLFVALIFFTATQAQPPDRRLDQTASSQLYEIKINRDNPLLVHVKAHLIAKDTLQMNTNCPNYDYPEGWATFVKNLKITQQETPVNSKYVSKSKWSLEKNPTAEMIQVEYDLDLSFTKAKWDVGNEQGGYTDGNAVYLVSKSLFIHGDSVENFIVKFDPPNDWKLSVPWTQTKRKNEFLVSNLDFLLENSLVFGNYSTSSETKNGFVFEFALLGEAAKSSELFGKTFNRIAAEYLEIFPDTPPSKYLVTMFYASQDDGESFHNSNAFTLSKPLNPDGNIIWANQMAHELFHYWNSDLIKAESYEDRQWFSEGFAEYYSNLTLLRTGIIDEPTFRSKAEKILGLYLNFKWRNPDITLKEAGKSKGRNRFVVYNGGWAAALALDLLIIEKTNGRKNLDDFMRAMFKKYRVTPYKYSDLTATASEVAGEDISSFFNIYVDGKETIPVEKNLNKIGYKVYDVVYEAEMYLVLQEKCELRNLWMRNKV